MNKVATEMIEAAKYFYRTEAVDPTEEITSLDPPSYEPWTEEDARWLMEMPDAEWEGILRAHLPN